MSASPPASINGQRNQWQRIQDIQLDGTPKNTFILLCSFIASVGVLANLPIIIANITHRCRRHTKMSDYYTMRFSDRKDGSKLVRASMAARRSTFVSEEDHRSPYFAAISMQAKYKYSHVILALSVFNLLSSLALIPLMIALVCGKLTADVSRPLTVLTLSWNVFQIMFVFCFQFINTTIQFLSICFPLRFSLRRSPLLAAFFIITALCLATAFSETRLMEDEYLTDMIRAEADDEEEYEEEEVDLSTKGKLAMTILVQIPFVIYWLTAALTLVMYGFIMRSIHNSQSFVRRASNPTTAAAAASPEQSRPSVSNFVRQSMLRFWNSIVRQNIQSFIMLGTSTMALYLLELPYMLVFCSTFANHYCVLIAHFSVHAVQPVLHITLSKAFRDVFKELFLTRPERSSVSFTEPIETDNPTSGG